MNSIWFLLAVAAVIATAQTATHSPWQGEWGSYKEAEAGGEMRSEGQRLSIHSCVGKSCQVIVNSSQLDGEHCDGTGQLTVESDTQATATLKPEFADPKNECTLSLTLGRQGSERRITVQKKKGNCGYYCTPKCSFDRAFAFRSASRFYGADIPGCFLARSKALSAVCSDKTLADLQQAWMARVGEVDRLFAQKSHVAQQRDQAQATCSKAEDPASCLRSFFQADDDRLTKRKAQWQASVTEPGDQQEAKRKSEAMKGRYEHSFANEMADGDRYRSTNRLEIKPAPNGEISFHVQLNFANGHQCSATGTAAYKKNGAFVYQARESGETCVLEVFPREKGIEFQDPTGGCNYYCGARGSFAGASFLYNERK